MTKALLFDFDGTLADTAPGIVLTMQETFRQMGLPEPADEEIRPTIGLPLVRCVKILGNLTDTEAEKGAEIYRVLFPTHELTHISMFPGVPDTLKELRSRGIRLAICTSRGKDSLQRILTRNNLFDCFETFTSASDNFTPKPSPEMVMVLLERMGLDKDEVYVVGDTTYDIQMGSSAGCRTIAVTYGNHNQELLQTSNPTHIINHFSSILNLI